MWKILELVGGVFGLIRAEITENMCPTKLVWSFLFLYVLVYLIWPEHEAPSKGKQLKAHKNTDQSVALEHFEPSYRYLQLSREKKYQVKILWIGDFGIKLVD